MKKTGKNKAPVTVFERMHDVSYCLDGKTKTIKKGVNENEGRVIMKKYERLVRANSPIVKGVSSFRIIPTNEIRVRDIIR